MEKTVELLMKNASLLDVELVAGVLQQEGIPHFFKEKGPGWRRWRLPVPRPPLGSISAAASLWEQICTCRENAWKQPWI